MKKALELLQIKRLLVIFFTITSITQAEAQELKITGSVSSNDGTPLSNVSVIVKNSLKGTTTDKIGHFQLTASINDSLVFSRIGYQPVWVKVVNSEPVNIKLSEASS